MTKMYKVTYGESTWAGNDWYADQEDAEKRYNEIAKVAEWGGIEEVIIKKGFFKEKIEAIIKIDGFIKKEGL